MSVSDREVQQRLTELRGVGTQEAMEEAAEIERDYEEYQQRQEKQDTGDGELTGEALDKRAQELDIPGRSEMTADEKREAVKEAERALT